MKDELLAKKAEIENEVAPKIRAYAKRHGLNDNAIVEGVIQFIVIAVLIVFVPGILYIVSTGTIQVPANTTYWAAQDNTSINVANGVQTVAVIPTILAIVLIIGVLMLLAMRR